ncbi:MAG: PSD1 and planctomycete cytochrome C domain-containing protein [Vicinamibacteraceae bacterium]
MASRSIRAGVLSATALAVGGCLWFGTDLLRPGHDVDFSRDIKPILNENCTTCHGGVKMAADFSLLFPDEALKPSKSGKPPIVPGDPDESLLVKRIEATDPSERMPLDHPALGPEKIDLLRRWIEQGATFEPHWAFVAPKRPSVPEPKEAAWAKTPIDRFVLARLEGEGIRPAQEAARRKLLRRVTLDLIGLPPTESELAQFVADRSPGAYERQVDRLLASPRFGERWAQWWLDLARYADTKGYEKDMSHDAWPYRDWVVRAFNEDLPFDRFTIEQLAGDLLPNATDEDRIASAFHRMTMTNDEGGTDDEEFRIAAVIDRVNTTYEVWQGVTMGCAQCHNHPYDPIRQEDFYRSFAFFNNTADDDREDELPTLGIYETDANRAKGRPLEARFRELKLQWEAMVEPEHPTDPPRMLTGAPKREYERLGKEVERLDEELDQLSIGLLPVMEELSGVARRETHIFERGNWTAPGKVVTAGVPVSLPPLPDGAPANRLGLAKWLVGPDNPLTPRVVVNRFWDQIFDAGLVETVADLGSQGEAPSHPELLDWLAVHFRDDLKWDMKRLLRLMVTSAAYRQDNKPRQELADRDPQNQLLARGPRDRLSAEMVRDQALAASGLLSTKMFGPAVMPPQPKGVWRSPYNDLEWETSPGEDKHRRGVYTFWKRSAPYPSFIAFDAPSREYCVSQRETTNTPLQALVLLNDPVYLESAAALAEEMRSWDGNPSKKLARGFKRLTARDPEPDELALIADYLKGAQARYAAAPEQAEALANGDAELAAYVATASMMLNLDEVLTK